MPLFPGLSELKLYPAEQVSRVQNRTMRSAHSRSTKPEKAMSCGESRPINNSWAASWPRSRSRSPASSDATDLSNIYAPWPFSIVVQDWRTLHPRVEARRLDLWRHWDRKLPNNPFVRRQLAGKSAPPSVLPKKSLEARQFPAPASDLLRKKGSTCRLFPAICDLTSRGRVRSLAG